MKLKLMLLAMVVAMVAIVPAQASKTYTISLTGYCDFFVLTEVNHVTAEVEAQPPNSKRYWTGYHDVVTDCGETSDFVDIGINMTINGKTPPEWDQHGAASASGINVNDSEELGLPVYYLVDLGNDIWANFFGDNDGNFYYYLEGTLSWSDAGARNHVHSKTSTAPIRTK